MLAGHAGHVLIGAQSGADALEFVGCDRNAEAGAADDDAEIDLLVEHCLGDCLADSGDITGRVDTIGRAEIFTFDALLMQMIHDLDV